MRKIGRITQTSFRKGPKRRGKARQASGLFLRRRIFTGGGKTFEQK